jgi:hypothetical protein
LIILIMLGEEYKLWSSARLGTARHGTVKTPLWPSTLQYNHHTSLSLVASKYVSPLFLSQLSAAISSARTAPSIDPQNLRLIFPLGFVLTTAITTAIHFLSAVH